MEGASSLINRRRKSGDQSKEANLRLISGTAQKVEVLWAYLLFSNGWVTHTGRQAHKYLNQGHGRGPGLILRICLRCDV